jgi:hypothetical protein
MICGHEENGCLRGRVDVEEEEEEERGMKGDSVEVTPDICGACCRQFHFTNPWAAKRGA